jgi:membrane protease YdiL (CAAX protease family)
LISFPLAALPSAALLSFVYLSLQATGIDTTGMMAPERSPSTKFFVGAVLIAPIIETLLLSILLEVLIRLRNQPIQVAVTSALLWGVLHGSFGALWFFGSVWSFFVFSCAYLGWRRQSYRHACIAAALPHAMVNLTVFIALALASAPSGAA